MTDIVRTTRPEGNFVVHAAAGTGKTWLLTSRIIHLLLTDANPGGILAITFTRKAAAEIEQRVMQRLLDMASCEPGNLRQKLLEIGCQPSAGILDKARTLYETLLVTEHPLRVTTFHAFCQNLLQRFPLESGLPPGFQIAENTQQLQDLAWRNFEKNLRHPKQQKCLQSYETLLQLLNNPVTVRNALYDFLRQRGDWLAFVEGEADASAYAQDKFDLMLQTDSVDEVFDPASCNQLRDRITRYRRLLAKHPTKPIVKRVQQIDENPLQNPADFVALNRAGGVFRDSKNKQRVFASNKTTLKNLGDKGLAELCELETLIQQQLDELLEQEKRRTNRKINYAWYQCGQALLGEYQQLKLQLEVLDFTDLEWQAYRLLNQSEFAHWVQYKLDQRIDHLLIDEFQDTNPTQWHLLLPLLDEMAAGQNDRGRSAFIVGDIKQSIYRFRRAAPGLFHHANNWLAINMDAESASQHKSYRSSPAIIEFVNLIFDQPIDDDGVDHHYRLHDFTTHDAHHQQRWGKVELLPLVKREKPAAAEKEAGFRNPLNAPRDHHLNIGEQQHQQEARQIITRVNEMLGQTISDDDVSRPLHFGDIMILVRSRTHTPIYEAELRRAGIPFTSASRDQFLNALEIKDIRNLLRALLSPFDNLALASVLRSPVFSCSNQTMVELARQPHKWWWQRLQQSADADNKHDPVSRAWHLLSGWRDLVDKIPVHDLLDKIFDQANIVNRYLAITPDNIRPRIVANLEYLLELALQMDSGRYPSLSQFVATLPYLVGDNEAPDTESGERVRLMTIHGAKGLEAPVVFLADAAQADRDHPASHHTITRWPDDSRKPASFFLAGKKADRDTISNNAYESHRLADKREEANLLYVALTRARHVLFISGCEPRSKDRGWYGFIESRLNQERQTLEQGMTGFDISLGDENDTTSPLILSFGQPDKHSTTEKPATDSREDFDDMLTRAIEVSETPAIINPSRKEAQDESYSHGENGDSVIARRRGVWLHRMLELLTDNNHPDKVMEKLKHESRIELDSSEFEHYWGQATQLLESKNVTQLLKPKGSCWVRNEMPVLYRQNGKSIFGIIDRIIVDNNQVTVIDYKTHESATSDNIAELAAPYNTQMKFYGDGVSKLWPDKEVKLLLLFTTCAETVEIPYPADT